MSKVYNASFFLSRIFGLMFLCTALFAPMQFCSAQTNANSGTAVSQQMHYSIPVVWDSKNNTLAPKQGAKVVLTQDNLMKDTGTGSQFYARVINFSNQPEAFQKNEYKLYLGQWKADASSQTSEINVTVPYFVDGSKVIFFDAKSTKAALSVDVSSLAKITQPVAKTQSGTQAVKSVVPAAKAPVKKSSGSSAILWIVLSILVVLILAGGGYFFWRWKKKGMQQPGDNMQVKI